MDKKFINTLTTLIEKTGAKFTLRDKPIAPIEILSDTGLLPAIAKRADQLASLCFGYGIGVVFEESQNASLGTKVVFDDSTPNVIRYLCIVDVITEIIKSSPPGDPVPLDELLYD